MSNIREILTKAVIGQARRVFNTTVKLPETPVLVGRVLGAVMTNHQVAAKKVGDEIEISGGYDVHVWYTHDDDKKTKIIRTNVDYGDLIGLDNPLRDNLLASDEVTVEEIVAPYATDVRVETGIVKVDVAFEVATEVIGETKMRVAILGPAGSTVPQELPYTPADDYLSEIDAAITPDFLDATIVHFD